jgi:hypothetical protein
MPRGAAVSVATAALFDLLPYTESTLWALNSDWLVVMIGLLVVAIIFAAGVWSYYLQHF